MIWLIGRGGMLGRIVEDELRAARLPYTASGKECDITNPTAISRGAPTPAPSWIVNCAGYTAVDGAEEEAGAAHALNSDGVANLARYCRSAGARMLHVSTDYIFDGTKLIGYSEGDTPAPRNVYGASKESGERRLRSTLPEHVIIRTSWLYAEHGRNFLLTVLRLLESRNELRIVNDQRATPTYALDLARAIRTILLNPQPSFGTFHFANAGDATWYDFAREIHTTALSLGLAAVPRRILPIPTREYPTAAERPECSILRCDRIGEHYGIHPRPWRAALSECMHRLASNGTATADTSGNNSSVTEPRQSPNGKATEFAIAVNTPHRSPRALTNILVTGGSGFIGANFIRYLFSQPEFRGRIVNIDVLTYAGNQDNLTNIEKQFGVNGSGRYIFQHADLRDSANLLDTFQRYEIDTVVHFAAESHVDRSILGPREFIETNVIGTFNLLEAARATWRKADENRTQNLFHHVSTDEVFGSLGETGVFHEHSPYDPRSPYSASKAAADHLVRAYGHTYGLPFTISNCSNNYGPFQFPEKMVPLMILNALERKELPVYGDGKNIRDWLYVDDHALAIWTILQHGALGETYLVGGENEWENSRLVKAICEKVATFERRPADTYSALIRYVTYRPGHDQRYAVNCNKIKTELGGRQQYRFSDGLDRTIRWYRDNRAWVTRVRSGAYKRWVEMNYAAR